MNWEDLNIRARFEEELLVEQFKKYQALKKKAAASRPLEKLQITSGPFLLQENGFYLLQENGKKIII
ncbi:hypothetical protein UFOVP699_202 [uncultured Caudovirales phage]|uniref:Uncharacterized protein n=1 Tax=uncultured Caudovirales phage TaxID=2100421 RepID=A0A6J5NNZ9_9CAUD|nr:hypothetical protein UFOVP699_202 [uncultured Caudovirales phage]